MKADHTLGYSFGFAVALSAAIGLAACGGKGGGNGGSGGSGTGGGDTHSTSSSSSTSTSSSSTSSSTSSGSTGCTEITLAAFQIGSGNGEQAEYSSSPVPDQGDATDTDYVNVDFYGSSLDAKYDGEKTGMFDLSKGGDANYASCSRCITLSQDPTSASSKTFFQASGTMNIDAASDQLNGTVTATLTDVKLVEVTVDSSTNTSTPVPGGSCLHIASASISYGPPAGWTCEAMYYGDGMCDCGCGVQDTDCPDLDIASCEYCDDVGSCSTDACPGTIDPANNAVCSP